MQKYCDFVEELADCDDSLYIVRNREFILDFFPGLADLGVAY